VEQRGLKASTLERTRKYYSFFIFLFLAKGKTKVEKMYFRSNQNYSTQAFFSLENCLQQQSDYLRIYCSLN
jgi:hypothetical protein